MSNVLPPTRYRRGNDVCGYQETRAEGRFPGRPFLPDQGMALPSATQGSHRGQRLTFDNLADLTYFWA